jgi:hypothetical protein
MGIKQAEKQKSINRFVPLMGLVIALALGVIAFFISGPIVDLIADQLGREDFEKRLLSGRVYPTEEERQEALDQQFLVVQGAFAAAFWLVMFVIVMTIFASLLGDDPDEEMRLVRPREGDAKGWAKYNKQLEKLEKKRAKWAEKKRREEARKKNKN